jgi:tetratricopeptide (TPR) repeat protein
MNANVSTSARSAHFAETWEGWVSLQHFLPASILRELLVEVVHDVTAGQFAFGDLFDEQLVGESVELTSWALNLKPVTSDLAYHVQVQVRGMLWMNDTVIDLQRGEAETPGILALSAAIQIGQLDFSLDRRVIDTFSIHARQMPLKSMCAALVALLEAQPEVLALDPYVLIASLVSEIPKPLGSIFVKHLGDLLADMDQWRGACSLYEKALAQLEEIHEGWEDLVPLMRTVIEQSRAAAAFILQGPEHSEKILTAKLGEPGNANSSLLFYNASHDVLSAAYKSTPPNLVPDRRPAFMHPPLLVGSHDVGSALKADSSGESNTAYRLFWSTLRRQFALGSISERKVTQQLYGVSLLRNCIKNPSAESFRLGVGLLIDAGEPRAVERVEWDAEIVKRFVSADLINLLIGKQTSYPSATVERGQVLVVLFGKWLLKLEHHHYELAQLMLNQVIWLAKSSSSSFYRWVDLLTPSVNVLKEVARYRPEFARHMGVSIVDFTLGVLGTVRNRYWKDFSDSFELAKVYLDYLEPEDQHKLFVATTKFLHDSGDNLVWTVIDPALTLLYSEASYRAAAEDTELGARIVETIVQFGSRQEHDHAQFLANFQHFPSSLLGLESVRLRLNAVIESVSHGISSRTSAAVGKIQALFLVPDLVGPDRILAGIQELRALLEQTTAYPHRHFMSNAFYPLRVLAHQIITEKLSRDGVLEKDLNLLFGKLLEIWSVVIQKPEIMASFSIPTKTQPEDALVHNWALATLEFGEALGRQSEASTRLDSARAVKQLATGVTLAYGTLQAERSTEGAFELDVNHVRSTNKEAFYASLGRYLLIMSNLGESRKDFVAALLDQILKFGPRDADVAILLAALQQRIPIEERAIDFSNYKQRALADSKARVLLQPVLSQLERAHLR